MVLDLRWSLLRGFFYVLDRKIGPRLVRFFDKAGRKGTIGRKVYLKLSKRFNPFDQTRKDIVRELRWRHGIKI